MNHIGPITYLISILVLLMFAGATYEETRNQTFLVVLLIISLVPYANVVAVCCSILYLVTKYVLNKLDN